MSVHSHNGLTPETTGAMSATSEYHASPWDSVSHVSLREDGLYGGVWKVHDTLPEEYPIVFKQHVVLTNTPDGPVHAVARVLVDGPDALRLAILNWTRSLKKRTRRMENTLKRNRFSFTEEEDKLILELIPACSNNFELVTQELNKRLPPGRRRIRQSVLSHYKKKLAGSAATATSTSFMDTTSGASSSLGPNNEPEQSAGPQPESS